MKKFLRIGLPLIALTIAAFTSCSDDNASNPWDDSPEEIQGFVSRYYPGLSITSCVRDGAYIDVKVQDGPEIEFLASDYSWVSIDGEGNTLPAMFIEDELPYALYTYLDGLDLVTSVLEVERNARKYEVEVTSGEITYNISTGTIIGPR